MRGRVMKSLIVGAGLLAALTFAVPPATLAQAGQSGGVDWTRIMRALGNALNSWRLSPFPRRTPTPIRSRTPTVAVPPSTATRTLTPLTHGVCDAHRAAADAHRVRRPGRRRRPARSTNTRIPSNTPLPRPTATPVPNDGQIAFAEAEGMPPAQKLASAFIVFPYLVTTPPFDTRIELMNMSNRQIGLQCFYVRAGRLRRRSASSSH